MPQDISQPLHPSSMDLLTISFGPDSLQNPHIAVVFTEQEWDEFQGPIMEVWASRIHADGDPPPPSTGR